MKTNFKFQEDLLHRGKGTINASGATNTLKGVDGLSDTEVLLREAVQNSYDARDEDVIINLQTKKKEKVKKILHFNIRAFCFSQDNINFINEVFDSENKNGYFAKNVKKDITLRNINIEISDLNTKGLIGYPGVTDLKEGQNFADFVYYTGNDKPVDSVDGGANGFGKAAYYLYSNARTLFIYTRIKNTNIKTGLVTYQSRLIAASLNEDIEGRCWWGISTQSTNESGVYAAPVIGDEADEIAIKLGFLPFEKEQTGTKLIIINAKPRKMPTFENGNPKTIDDIIKYDIPAYLVHWYWNKIVNGEIVFTINYKGENIEIDDPSKVYPYKYFIEADKRREAIKKGYIKPDNKRSVKIVYTRYNKPIVDLGIACIETTTPRKAKYADLIKSLNTSQPLIAFMRGIGNIVYYGRYNVGPEDIEETCFGIFACDTKAHTDLEKPGEIDRYFRGIENTAHTRWVHDSNKFLNDYFKRVDQEVDNLVRNNCKFEEIDDSAANISILIQRTLGSKLLPYKHSFGGAKKSLQPKTITEPRASSEKSSITKTGNNDLIIDENNKKIVLIQYKINLKKGKKIIIHNITPVIETPDGGILDVEQDFIKYLSRTKIDRDGTKNFLPGIPKEIKRPETCYFNIECKKECSFDLRIDWEEVDG